MTMQSKRAAIVLAASFALHAGNVASHAGSALAAGPVSDGSGQPSQSTPNKLDTQTSKVPAKSSSSAQDSRKRGRLPDLTTMCEVTPPCPVGCREDVKKNACVENPPP